MNTIPFLRSAFLTIAPLVPFYKCDNPGGPLGDHPLSAIGKYALLRVTFLFPATVSLSCYDVMNSLVFVSRLDIVLSPTVSVDSHKIASGDDRI